MKKRIASFEIIVIFLVNLIFYLQAFLNSKNFFSKVLPAGDPFTYTIGYYSLLNQVGNNFSSVLLAFKSLFLGNINWYWLTDFFIILLSPFLHKEMYSLIVINFVLYFIWCIFTFYLGKIFLRNTFSQIVFSLLPWVFPMNFGMVEYSSPGTMGLDAAFVPMLGIALVSFFLLLSKPNSQRLAFLSAVTCTFAIFGRGNSLPVVLLVIFVPFCALFIWAKRNNFRSLFTFLGIFSLGTFYFYFSNWGPISNYYNNHLQFVERHTYNFQDFKPYILNIPGFMFWRSENSFVTVLLSVVIHFLVLITAILVFKRRRAFSSFDLSLTLKVTGIFIYFGTYFTNLLLFTDPLMNIYNALLIWRPMLLGLLCLLFGYFPSYRGFETKLRLSLFLLFLIVFSTFFTVKQTPWEWANNRPKPVEVQRLVEKLSTQESVSLLWYGNINPQILDYYYTQENSEHLKIYRGANYNNLWSPWDYSDSNRSLVAGEILEQFNKASVVIVPEYLDQYQLGQPYAINHFRSEFLKLYASNLLPSMKVVGIINENDKDRLLVLSKNDINDSIDSWKPVMKGEE